MEKEKEKQEIITKEEAEKMMEEDANPSAQNVKIGWRAIMLFSAVIVCGAGIIVTNTHTAHRPKKSFTYKIDRDGKIQVSGRVKFKEVKNNWYLLEKQLNDGKSRLYIVDCQVFREFVNIHTNKKMARTSIWSSTGEYSDETILNLESLEPYLLTYDMIYDSYTIEDMDQLLGLIEEDYEYVIPDESNKIMMKTNE